MKTLELCGNIQCVISYQISYEISNEILIKNIIIRSNLMKELSRS